MHLYISSDIYGIYNHQSGKYDDVRRACVWRMHPHPKIKCIDEENTMELVL